MNIRHLVLCSVVLTAGCGTGVIHDSLQVMRDDNKRKLSGLRVDMPRAEVENVMGNQPAGGSVFDILFGRFQYLGASNPMREERVRGADGAEYVVLFYYTDLRARDNKITDDELTPVVFRDGRVAGFGYAYLGERVAKYSSVR